MVIDFNFVYFYNVDFSDTNNKYNSIGSINNFMTYFTNLSLNSKFYFHFSHCFSRDFEIIENKFYITSYSKPNINNAAKIHLNRNHNFHNNVHDHSIQIVIQNHASGNNFCNNDLKSNINFRLNYIH